MDVSCKPARGTHSLRRVMAIVADHEEFADCVEQLPDVRTDILCMSGLINC
jgi:hypothetical protein